MEIDFVYSWDIKNMIDMNIIKYEGSIEDTRGLSITSWKKAMINLSSNMWKFWHIFGIGKLIEEVGKTITHENTHLLIDTKDKYTPEGEEMCCRMLSGQVVG